LVCQKKQKNFSVEIIFKRWYKGCQPQGWGFNQGSNSIEYFPVPIIFSKKLERYHRILDLLEKGIGIGL
jgi:hypothetical protein